MTELSVEKLQQLESEALAALTKVATAADLEQWRVTYLGRKGHIPALLRQVKKVPQEQRAAVGQVANKLRQKLTAAYQEKQKEKIALEESVANSSHLQTTNYKLQTSQGHLHPLTLAIRRVSTTLSELGFQLVEGPLVEDPRYNFDYLNIPLEHPARAETDTFHLTNGLVLRTHTSPVQVRAVLEQHLTPPFKIFSPGRVFRAEKLDPTHSHTFHQFEGLAVDTKVTIADFKGVITALYSQFFNKEVTIRLRPSFFPFVEPGFEVDMSCVFCEDGCRVCKNTTWIEIMGAGMVHPNVLRNMNIDPNQYQGYAFGGAIDRLAMLRHNIDDIRLFWSGDLRFLRQFHNSSSS